MKLKIRVGQKAKFIVTDMKVESKENTSKLIKYYKAENERKKSCEEAIDEIKLKFTIPKILNGLDSAFFAYEAVCGHSSALRDLTYLVDLLVG